MSALPYSYHTFLFPFIWKTSEEKNREEFERILSVGKRWIDKSWKSEKVRSDVVKQSEWFQDYAAFQYFTKSANNVIFNTRGDNVVKCFEYYQHKGNYTISKNGVDYRLVINNIRLNVYDIGIAVLIFELENHEHRRLNDVNIINEHGRRINLPFLMASDGKKSISHALCADKITVSFEGVCFTEDYVRTMHSIGQNTDYLKRHIAMNYIMRPIQELLDGKGEDNGGYEVTAHEEHQSSNIYYIKPCIDDRMFVCCLVRDGDYSNKIKEYDAERGEYRYLSDCFKFNAEGRAEESGLDLDIYKLMYVETSVSCQSASMRHELLKRTVYDRWIDWGTIHGVTHHSMICLTSAYEGIIDSVINPFLTQYVQIAVLAVVQRAVILHLSDEAAEVANGFVGERVITKEELENIERLQAKYVTAQNQLLLSEVTVQEQGVEIYEMLKNELYIEKNMEDLDSEISNLRDVADIANARLERMNDEEEAKREKKIERGLALLSGVLGSVSIAEPFAEPINTLLGNLFGQTIQENDAVRVLFEYNFVWAVISIVLAPIIYKITNYVMKDKSEKRK